MSERKKIAVLVSGGGTNLQALIDAQQAGQLGNGRLACVISSRADAFALKRAKKAGIEALTLSAKFFPGEAYDRELVRLLKERDIQLVVLAGFLRILGEQLIAAFSGRIVNVHPSLIPAFCGAGFYGLRVHEAALERGVKITGATVHLVNGVVDGGPILLQKAVEVVEGDTPETLQRRVMEQAEWELLPRAVALLCTDEIR
ncbi:phosphoribosylglycinamide formyltransferase [Oscillospiraceae bacterium MB08-C2-2]|nr:phosphoribosylglycinamide formyltransferase [Oscillospiraceae bacterium MB08-C2-2]